MMNNSPHTTRRARKKTVFNVYARHIARYPILFSATVLLSLIMQGTYIAAPLFLRQFFNDLADNFPSPDAVHVLLSILAVVVLVWVIDWLAHRVQYVCVMYLETGVMSGLYHSSFDYLLGHSYHFFISNFAGSLTHKVKQLIKAFEILFDAVVNNMFPTLVFILGAIVVLFIRSPILGIVLFIWTVLFLLFQVYVARVRLPARIARAAADSRVTGNLADAISNQSTIALFSGAQYEIARFRETVADWVKAFLRTWWIDAWIWFGIGFFIIAIQAILLYVGVRLWQQGLFTVGDFVLIQAYLLTAFERLEKINRDLRRANDAYSNAEEMIEILNMSHEVADAPGAKELAILEGRVEFKDVGFKYQKGQHVFEHFHLDIAPREKVALVGPSGGGKTTLTKLLLRLFDVAGGSIEIDGQDIAAVKQESLREQIGFVPQEPILFHRTLMENIRYGRRDASDEEVIGAAKQAYCHEFISRLPHGYETYVGERGVKLSGGERQRVAIARAILKDAPILVLDEATSSLDSASELLIQDALSNLMSGKTVVVIAHRLSTIMKMDRIIVLDDGRVIEEGSHQALLAKKGLYAKLWSHQAGGFIRDS